MDIIVPETFMLAPSASRVFSKFFLEYQKVGFDDYTILQIIFNYYGLLSQRTKLAIKGCFKVNESKHGFDYIL